MAFGYSDAKGKSEKALAIRPHPNPLPRGEGGTIAGCLTVDARRDLAARWQRSDHDFQAHHRRHRIGDSRF